MKRFVLILSLGILILLLTAWFFNEIFSYFIFGIVVTALLRPLVRLIQQISFYNFNLPRSLAILGAYLVLLGFMSAFVLLFVPLIEDQIRVLMSVDLVRGYSNLLKPIESIEAFVIKNFRLDQEPGFLVYTIKEGVINFIGDIDFQKLVNGIISLTGNVFVSLLAVGFISFFLLYENGMIRRQVILIVPNQYFEVFIAALLKIEKLLSNYLIGLLIQMLSIFSIASVGLSLVGVNYALTIALFAALANLIPYLGPVLGAVFGILVGFSTTGSLVFDQSSLILVLKILVVFSVVQITDNVFLQPLIFSRSVKTHPLEIFVVIFAGASLAGIPGMIAAIPVYTVFRVSGVEINSGIRSYTIFQKQ